MRWLISRILGNLGYVGSGIWRSAQRWYLYPIWALLGLKTIINVAASERDPQDRFERKFCKWFGINYVAFDNLGPTYNFDEAYKSLQECEKPVLVHCEGGRDRTGGLLAVYKREVLGSTFTGIVEDWPIYGTPDEGWLIFLFERL